MYRVEVKKKAEKDILALPKKDQERIIAAFDILGMNPFVGKKMQGEFQGAWSLRVWPHRILYTVDQKIVTVTVLRVGHRQGVYN